MKIKLLHIIIFNHFMILFKLKNKIIYEKIIFILF